MAAIVGTAQAESIAEKIKIKANDMQQQQDERIKKLEMTSVDDKGFRTVTVSHGGSSNSSKKESTRFTTVHPGDGVTFATTGSKIKCHYTGTLLSGYTFDSSREKDKEYDITVGKDSLIQGWEWALAKMTLGERIILNVAPCWAYGERGVPGHIPPMSELQFDLQLLQINENRVKDSSAILLNERLLKETKEETLAGWMDEINVSGGDSGSGSGRGGGRGGSKNKGGNKGNKKKKKKKKR